LHDASLLRVVARVLLRRCGWLCMAWVFLSI